MKADFEIVIEPNKNLKHYWKELWLYRELFVFLAWRDILVRYKQTVIGIVWAVIRPLLTMIVFTIIFGKIAKLDSNGMPYPILVFSAMLPWQLFASSLSESSSSLISNANMISKVYFPRIIVPFSSIMVNLVDFIISFSILLILMFWFGYYPNEKILLLPVLVLLTLFIAAGFSLWFSALNVMYRDFKYIVPFVVQFGLYISPVGFSSSQIPKDWQFIYSLNPMVGIIDGFRWAVSGQSLPIYLEGFILSIFISILVFLSGIWYFRRTERIFADYI